MENLFQFKGLTPDELALERDKCVQDPTCAGIWETALQVAESRQYLGNLIERLIAIVERVEKAVQK